VAAENIRLGQLASDLLLAGIHYLGPRRGPPDLLQVARLDRVTKYNPHGNAISASYWPRSSSTGAFDVPAARQPAHRTAPDRPARG
jgi:hypothetical protein